MNFHETSTGIVVGGLPGPQDGTQNDPRSTQDGSETISERVLFDLEFRLRFYVVWNRFSVDLGPPSASQDDPEIDHKSIQKSIKNRLAARWPPRPLQDRPRASQDAPRTPSDPLKTPQDPPKTPPKSLPGPSWTVQKIENFEIVENMSKKSRPWSPTMVTQYHRSKESKVSSQQSNPRGWRRWSREALFNK